MADGGEREKQRGAALRSAGTAALRVLLVGYGVLTASLIAIGLLLTHTLDGSVGSWDTHVNRWFVQHRTPLWDSVTSAVTFMLNTEPVIAVALIVVALLAWRHRWREAFVIAFGLTLEIAVFLSVTFVVARPRPDVARLDAAPMTSSFPSGHTAAAMVLYGGIALAVQSCTRKPLARTAAWFAAGAAAVLVALSRTYRGMHHPTDVVTGVVFGIACLWFAVHAVHAASDAAETAGTEPAGVSVGGSGQRQRQQVESEVVA